MQLSFRFFALASFLKHKLYSFISLSGVGTEKNSDVSVESGQWMFNSFWVNIDFGEQLVLICFVMKTYWDNKVFEKMQWTKKHTHTNGNEWEQKTTEWKVPIDVSCFCFYFYFYFCLQK